MQTIKYYISSLIYLLPYLETNVTFTPKKFLPDWKAMYKVTLMQSKGLARPTVVLQYNLALQYEGHVLGSINQLGIYWGTELIVKLEIDKKKKKDVTIISESRTNQNQYLHFLESV